MDGRSTWTDCDEAGDYVVPNVLSPRDLVFRPDNMDETVPHTGDQYKTKAVVGGTAGPAMAGPLFWPKIVLAGPFLGPIMIFFFLPGHFLGCLDFIIR